MDEIMFELKYEDGTRETLSSESAYEKLDSLGADYDALDSLLSLCTATPGSKEVIGCGGYNGPPYVEATRL